MNETYIQTIRGGIQHVIHLAKDHWTQTPKPCGFYYRHELYGYIRVSKLYDLIVGVWDEAHTGWEEYAWLCYENRYLTIEQMAAAHIGRRHTLSIASARYLLKFRFERPHRLVRTPTVL